MNLSRPLRRPMRSLEPAVLGWLYSTSLEQECCRDTWGQVLKMFVRTHSKCVGHGMFTGYSAWRWQRFTRNWAFSCLRGRSICCDFAQALFKGLSQGAKISVQLGPALETLSKLAAQSFDFVFIDADKQEYVQYFHLLLDSGLFAPHGFICVDNTLLQGSLSAGPSELERRSDRRVQPHCEK